MTAMSEAGILSSFLGHRMSIASETQPMRSAQPLSESKQRKISLSLSTVSIGEFSKVSPKKSLT